MWLTPGVVDSMELSPGHCGFAQVVQKQKSKYMLARTENLSPWQEHLCTERLSGGTYALLLTVAHFAVMK